MHGVTVDVKEGQLEQKVINILLQLNINISKPDSKECYRLGKSNTIVGFVNRKVFKDALEKNFRINRFIDNSKLGFKSKKKVLVAKESK